MNLLNKSLIKQMTIFLIIGTFAALINLGIFYILTEFIKIYYLFSAIFSFFIAFLFGYILNKKITFKEKINYFILRKGIKFLVINLLALSLNLILLYILTEIFGIYYLFSQVISLSLASIINFSGHKFWTFKET